VEEISTEKSGKLRRGILILFVIGAFATFLVVACGKVLGSTPIRDALDPENPALNLNLTWYDKDGKVLSSSPDSGTAVPTSTRDPQLAKCPQVIGGDLRRTFTQPSTWDEEELAKCPKEVIWNVVKHPVAVTVNVGDGTSLLRFIDQNPTAKNFFDSNLVKGALRDLIILTKTRAEPLRLDGLKGEFIKPILREILAAKATFFYDAYHGSDGLVFSFERASAPVAAAALPIIVKYLTRLSYELNGFTDPIVELVIQGQKFLLTEVSGRVYVGKNLEVLVNTISNAQTNPLQSANTLDVEVKAEAFLGKILGQLSGKDQWATRFSFDLNEKEGKPATANFDSAQVFTRLSPSLSKGVLAAIPRDVFGAFITSASIPSGVPACEWKGFLDGSVKPSSGPDAEGGVAFVWDLIGTGQDKTSAVGVAVAAPQGADIEEFNSLFAKADQGLATTCAGGAIWIASSSNLLITRMKEACDKQSHSVLDWSQGAPFALDPTIQAATFINLAAAVEELYQRGGGMSHSAATGELTPEQEMSKAVADEALAHAKQLPIIGYAGRLAADGRLQMNGFVQSGSM